MSTLRIKGAWWVCGRARVSNPGHADFQVGKLYARTEDDKIYVHRKTQFTNPKGMVEQVRRRRVIDTEFWNFHADDAEAVAYFANHFEPGEPRS